MHVGSRCHCGAPRGGRAGVAPRFASSLARPSEPEVIKEALITSHSVEGGLSNGHRHSHS